MASNPRLIDMAGRQCGSWAVLDKAGNTPGGGALWLCRCKCGVVRAVLGADLRNGKSVSCGCENLQRLGRAARRHGGRGTRLYNIWKSMRSRPYLDWNGAKISVDPVWDSFPAFESWALENGYTSALSIERKDNRLGYSPANCVWANAQTQSLNRRIVLRSPSGEPWCEIAKRNGISVSLMHGRIHAGWSPERAATQPLRPQLSNKGRFVV